MTVRITNRIAKAAVEAAERERKDVKCGVCDGTGRNADGAKCTWCTGTGWSWRDEHKGMRVPCADCDSAGIKSTGYGHEYTCLKCLGHGYRWATIEKA